MVKFMKKNREYDSERDSKLLNKGIYVLRIKNEELDDMNSVLNILNETISLRVIQVNNKEE